MQADISLTYPLGGGLHLRAVEATEVPLASDVARAAFNSHGVGEAVKIEMADLIPPEGCRPLGDAQSKYMEAEYFFLCEEGASRPLGLTGLYRVADSSRHVVGLGWFCVDSGHRKQGLGRRLLDSTIRLAVARGMTRMVIETSPGLKPAIGLYTSAGFTLHGQVPDYYGPGSDLLIYSRRLEGFTPLQPHPRPLS